MKFSRVGLEELKTKKELIATMFDEAFKHDLVGRGKGLDVLSSAISDPKVTHIWKMSHKGEDLCYVNTEASTVSGDNSISINTMTSTGTSIHFNDYSDELMSNLEKQARLGGFDKLIVRGRTGWIRQLKPYGYHHSISILVKDLGDNNEDS